MTGNTHADAVTNWLPVAAGAGDSRQRGEWGRDRLQAPCAEQDWCWAKGGQGHGAALQAAGAPQPPPCRTWTSWGQKSCWKAEQLRLCQHLCPSRARCVGFFPLSQLGKCLSQGTSCHAWFYLFTSRSGELDVGLEEPRSWTAEPKEHKALSCCSATAVPCVLPVRNTRTVEVQLCAGMCDVLNYNKRGNTTTAGPGPWALGVL